MVENQVMAGRQKKFEWKKKRRERWREAFIPRI